MSHEEDVGRVVGVATEGAIPGEDKVEEVQDVVSVGGKVLILAPKLLLLAVFQMTILL